MESRRNANASSPASWFRQHPDLAALALLLLVGAVIRAAFLFRAPAFFVGGDSQTYLLPAHELVRDGNWDLGYRRPPGYPLFLAGVIATLGEDMRALGFAQHLLGLATIAASYGLALAIAGRPLAVVVGLATALSGPLLVYEHYVMSDALFLAILTTAAWALFAARRSNRLSFALVAGVLLGAGWLTRPAALLLLPVIPLAFLGVTGGWRRLALLSGAVGLTYLILAGPWAVLSLQRYGTLGSIGLGNNLMWRMTRHEPAIIQPRDTWPSRDTDPAAAARRYAFGQATRKELPDDIADGLEQRFGLTEIEADRVLVATAVDAIRARLLLYVRSTGELALELFLGTEQFLGGQGKEGGVDRYANPQERYQGWWNERIRHIPQPPTPAEAAEFSRARDIAEIFQPHRLSPILLVLSLAGLLGGLASPRYRPAIFLSATIAVGLLGSAALSGSTQRFRYPYDPMIWTLAGIGALAAFEAVRAVVRRAQRVQVSPDATDTVAVQPAPR